jgi:hypothetical protein
MLIDGKGNIKSSELKKKMKGERVRKSLKKPTRIRG